MTLARNEPTDTVYQSFQISFAIRAENEQLLLEKYGVHKPHVKQALVNDPAGDYILRQMLNRYHLVLLGTLTIIYSEGSYFFTQPPSHAIRGSEVSNKNSPGCTIMWTTSFILQKVSAFCPNHFVPLIDHRQPDLLDTAPTKNILPQEHL
ncbi:hypothetical protein RRG08_036524 [Elysia crispata]|uniref:Uncharacterized protein n=1 Tax=Elysia crispata TaxID=231223 RepID=A0AAE1D5N9_9GAST|nr:hypothetical protein RRG08_036524 [Elysia crispata]